MFIPLNVGIADNGDYTRAMTWVTSGPATMTENWPSAGTELARRRFLNYWIPYWRLDAPNQPAVLTSTAVLWLLGAAINWLFYSRHVLYLPVVSLVPRLAFVAAFVLWLRWTSGGGVSRATRIVLHVLVGVPLALFLMATQYVRVFNSFYRETGTMVYLLCFIASLVALMRGRREWWGYVLVGGALVLLTTAKISNVYWPLVALPVFVLVAQPRGRRWVGVAVCGTGAVLAVIAFPHSELEGIRDNVPYQAVHAGLLQFSDNPSKHLERLGLADTAPFVGLSAFEPGPSAWLHSHRARVRESMVLDVFFHEPRTGLREMRYAARAMQNLTAANAALGERAEGDPTPRDHWMPQRAWGAVKDHVFPRGDALYVALPILAAIFWVGCRRRGLIRELSAVGLMVTVACPVDIAIQVFGAGAPDIARHLLIADFLFDLAVLALAGVAATAGGELLEELRSARVQPRDPAVRNA